VFLAEALVGLARLALVTLCGLPVLAVLAAHGLIRPDAVVPLLVLPFTWGAITGFGLIVWAYEPAEVRRWGERAVLALLLVYLGAGVLGAELLLAWGTRLPSGVLDFLQGRVAAFFQYNPFAVVRDCHRQGLEATWRTAAGVELWSLALLALL